MRRVGVLVSLVSLAAVLGACSSPTELMLVIKAGPGLRIADGAPQSIDSLEVQAGPRTGDPTNQNFFFGKIIGLCTEGDQPDCRPQQYAARDYMGALTLPIQLLLEPGSQGLDEEIHVWVDGYKSTGEHQLSSGVHFTFSKGNRLWIELPLFGECVGDLDCEPTDTACIATGTDRNCVDIPATSYEPDMATAPDGMHRVDQGTLDQGPEDLGSHMDMPAPDFSMPPPDLTVPPPDLTVPPPDLSNGGCPSGCYRNGDMGCVPDPPPPPPGEPVPYSEPAQPTPSMGTCASGSGI